LDVGCGSGVLAIACARRWPSAEGVGIDVDPDAVDVSRENAERNHVSDHIRFYANALDAVPGSFQVVVANIQPEILIPMASALSARLAQRGCLILSGILIEAAEPVVEAYRQAGLTDCVMRDEEGWRALLLRRGR
jgi:ribosomal protein L11 methyltransferase